MPEENKKLEEARILMDNFAKWTGLSTNEGNIEERYLWTDAFAVQAFFGLAHVFGDDIYKKYALKLIDAVHEILGHYHRDDIRKGWISGLSEQEGKKHPTAGGLRIGKKLLERKPDEPFNERLEWERDGQYFHYITRWINALLQAEVETGEHHFILWAAELLQSAEKFINKRGGRIGMYWKMSIDLSRPLVEGMGAHDPLEGLLCAKSILDIVPEKSGQLAPLVQDLEKLCAGQNWLTTDPLGIGGLLLNTIRAAELAAINTSLPDGIRPEKLFSDSLYGLKIYLQSYNKAESATARLAFRECGLSLGLRTMYVLKGRPESNIKPGELDRFISLADNIEDFWLRPENQEIFTWVEHLNINLVSLSSSIIAKHYPFAFCALRTIPWNDRKQ
jgi:hypothetical protein